MCLKPEVKDRIIKILKNHGILMNIDGCGCCGSPLVSFSYNGELIIDTEVEFILEMIEPVDSKGE